MTAAYSSQEAASGEARPLLEPYLVNDVAKGKKGEHHHHPIWRGNFSVWWLVGAVYAMWFTVGHGIPYLVRDPSPLFGVHLVNACLVTWLCLANLFHTPSHGPAYKWAHRVLGHLALVSGTLSTVFGLLTVWYERYHGVSVFAIAISVGGVGQVLAQVRAITAVRRGDIREHIRLNHVAFYAGCLAPAIIRLPALIRRDLGPHWDLGSWFIPMGLGYLAFRAKLRDSWI